VLRGKHLTEEGETVQVLGSRVEGVDALVALPTRRPNAALPENLPLARPKGQHAAQE
jgi:hypothetical protein